MQKRSCRLKRLLKLSTIVFAASLSLATGPTFAQGNSLDSLERRMQRIEQDLGVLQRDYFRPAQGNAGSLPAGGATIENAANIEVRIMALENEIRSLTGLIEQVSHRMDLMESSSRKLAEDVEFRLREVETGGTGSAPGLTGSSVPGAAPENTELTTRALPTTVQSAPVSPAVIETPIPADQRYNDARRMIAQGRYVDAERALRGLLSAYPESELAPNAQYWLGETFYVRQLYEEAATTFVTGLQEYGTSSKGPDYMLKLGMSLIGMDNKADGCAALAALPDRYSDAPAQILTRAEDMRQRFQCP